MGGVVIGEDWFEKLMSNTDRRSRLSLPTACLHLFCNPENPPVDPIVIMTEDGAGNPFSLRLRVRRSQGYLKPEITGDWLRFVDNKNLNPGDRVVFYKHPFVNNNNNMPLFTIYVRRPVKVLGAVIGHQIE